MVMSLVVIKEKVEGQKNGSEVPAAKLDNPSSIPRTHVVEGKNRLQQVVP